jgi:hypothetical protein
VTKASHPRHLPNNLGVYPPVSVYAQTTILEDGYGLILGMLMHVKCMHIVYFHIFQHIYML